MTIRLYLRVVAFVLLSAPLLASCRSEDRAGGVGETDALTLDSIPALLIAGSSPSGEIVFGSAEDGTVLSDGRIVIADAVEHAVRFFDANGTPELAVGREGEGPGEFDLISWLGQCGADSLYVWDARLNRMTVLGQSGELVTTFRVPDDPAVADASMIACSRQGAFLAFGFPFGGVRATDRFSAPMWLVDARGTITRSFGDVPIYEGHPLGRVASVAVGGERFYVGTKDSLFVDAYSFEGQIVSQFQVADSFRPPTAYHNELAIDARCRMLGSVDDRRIMRDIMLRWPMPELLQPYDDLFVDPNERLWVQLSLLGDPETLLRAFDANGEMVTEVRIPLYVKVFEVGEDHILGAYEDESGEPFVALYRLF